MKPRLDVLTPVMVYERDVTFYDGLATALEERGAAVGLLTLSEAGYQALSKKHPHVFRLYQGLERDRPAPEAEVERIVVTYHLHNIRDFVFPDCLLLGESTERGVARAVHIFQVIERILGEYDVGLLFNNVGPELVRRAMSFLGASSGPPSVILDFAPFHGRATLTTSEIEWDELPREPPPLEADELARTNALIAEVVGRKKMFARPQPLGIDAGSLVRPFRNIARLYLRERGEMDGSFGVIYGRRLANVGRRALSRFYFEEPRDEPFLFFPLHVPDDSAITVRAPQFQHQDALLEYLATRALPSGMKLYVKPHPAGIDTYPVPFLRRIAALPDVRLIEPRVNSHELIARARAVVVINSTVGFESLFHKKPVVMLGRTFYRGHGATFDVENLGDLVEVVARAVRGPVDGDAIVRLIAAAYRETIPAVFASEEPDNLRVLAREILAKRDRLVARAALAASR